MVLKVQTKAGSRLKVWIMPMYTKEVAESLQRTHFLSKNISLDSASLPESYQDGYVDPETDSVYIHLNNTSISVEGDSNGYAEVNGSTVTINHSGTYYVDGTLDDGQINVNIADETADPDTVKIFLNGASITGKSDSPFVVTNAEKTSINLVDGTTNTISDGDTAYTSGNAVIEAKDDLTIKGGDNGTGKLIVTANTQDGIVCNNDLKINNADVSVTTLNSTSGSKTNGINGKTSVDIKGTSVVTVDATSDGIKSTNGNVLIESGKLPSRPVQTLYSPAQRSIFRAEVLLQAATEVSRQRQV